MMETKITETQKHPRDMSLEELRQFKFDLFITVKDSLNFAHMGDICEVLGDENSDESGRYEGGGITIGWRGSQWYIYEGANLVFDTTQQLGIPGAWQQVIEDTHLAAVVAREERKRMSEAEERKNILCQLGIEV